MPQQKQSTLALVALILSVLCAPVGLILGIIALININNSKGQLGGKGLALAAIILPVAMVPVIGILAAIAIPNFIRYQNRAKGSEVRTVLGGIKTSQEAFRSTEDVYVSFGPTPSAPVSTQKVAWESQPCSKECSGKNPGECASAECINFRPAGPVYYRYACNALAAQGDDPPEFTCAAVGDLDGDGKPGVFIYASGNKPGASAPRAPIPEIAAGSCRGIIPTNEVFDCARGDF